MRYIDSVSSISITTGGVLLHGAKTAALAAAAGTSIDVDIRRTLC